MKIKKCPKCGTKLKIIEGLFATKWFCDNCCKFYGKVKFPKGKEPSCFDNMRFYGRDYLK